MRKIILLISGLVLLWGCFGIRTVEPPQQTASDWVSPTNYEILLANFRESLATQNTQNYLRCFNQDSFRFAPSISLFNDNESVWVNWSILDEQAYLENTFANLSVQSGNTLILNEEDIQNASTDSVRYVGTYTLRMNHMDTSITTLFKGQLQLVMRLNEFNEWEIQRWTDIELYPDSSWSELKLRYVQ